MKRAFTFIELLIAISIMMIMLLLSFPFYISINKQLTIDRATTRLIQDLRRATEMAMSAQEFNNSYPAGGYGIYFPSGISNEYWLFADLDGNHAYGSGELVEKVKIEGRINITDKTASLGNITFMAPEPIVFLSNSSGASLGATVTEVFILFSDGSNSNTIYINKAGLVYIQ